MTNNTDDEGACYELTAAFKNVGGSLTQIGATVVTQAFEDAGQTGLSATIDSSGTAIRVRLTTDSTDTVLAQATVDFYEITLT